MYGISASGDEIGGYCQGITFNQYNVTDIGSLKVGVRKKFVPIDFDVGSVTFSFITSAPDLITSYMDKWRTLIVDNLGRFNLPTTYKKAIYVILEYPSGDVANVIALKGVFPVSFPAYNLRYGSEELVGYELEFKFDDVDPNTKEFAQFKKSTPVIEKHIPTQKRVERIKKITTESELKQTIDKLRNAVLTTRKHYIETKSKISRGRSKYTIYYPGKVEKIPQRTQEFIRRNKHFFD
jgi:hypothetical protein